jgi:hypothetical protein
MEPAPATTQTWALLLDPASANAVIEHLSKLRLPRRICRPLDRRQERIENSDLARFDAAVEAAVEAEAASDEIMAEV